MISVAMALYNSLSYIEEQLDSIRNQTVSVDEVIMIDDCSTDNTVAWINEYINVYNLNSWRIECHEENKGYIDTFYEAIEKCTGDIIILCDHDDIWLEKKVEIIKKTFEKEHGILMLATSFERIDKNGKIIPVKLKKGHANNNLIRRNVRKGTLNKMSFYDVAIYNVSPGCTCAISSKIKKDLLKNRCSLPHDWTLSILAACYDSLYYLDIITTLYRIYDKNTIGLGHEDLFKKRKKIVENNLNEKESMKTIVEEYKGNDSQEYRFCKKVFEVFSLRTKSLNNNSIMIAILALIKSLGMNRLFESVIMDIISMIKNNHSKSFDNLVFLK